MANNIATRTEVAAACLRNNGLLNSLTISNTQLNAIVDDMVYDLAKRLGYQPEESMDYKINISIIAEPRSTK
ncbi:hypothetical protein HYT23_01910 [Candidatus Pacearchaeota archaeon]|nr:hypothetical protein [Candidatus Pacearchaeota archaeon]